MNAKFNEDMRALRRDYQKKLPTVVGRLDALLGSLKSSPDKTTIAHELKREVHSFIGSSGLYGFPQFSQKARDLYFTIEKCERQEQWNQATFDKIWSHIFALQNQVSRVTVDASSSQVGESVECVPMLHPVKPLKILVVSDDRPTSELLNASLSANGYKVVDAVDGADAVSKYAETSPDFILSEVMMPQMNGYEVSQWIRAHETGGYVPIVFLTSLTEADDLVRCIASGGDDFVTKPIDMNVLTAKVFALNRLRLATMRVA